MAQDSTWDHVGQGRARTIDQGRAGRMDHGPGPLRDHGPGTGPWAINGLSINGFFERCFCGRLPMTCPWHIPTPIDFVFCVFGNRPPIPPSVLFSFIWVYALRISSIRSLGAMGHGARFVASLSSQRTHTQNTIWDLRI